MDDLKLYVKSESEIKGLASTVEVFSQDIGMGFGIKKYGVIIMNRGKVESTDVIELPSGEKIREIEENGCKYLGILEYDRIKEQEMKYKLRNKYFRRAKLILKSKLNGRNKIMALNTWAVSIVRCGAGILKWNKNELQEMDRKTRKFMTMNKELHPRSDVARLHISRKNGGRGLIACENSVKSEENGLGWYVNHYYYYIEPLLVAVRASRTIIHEETIYPKEFKKTKDEQRKNEWTAKRMHGQFTRDMENRDKNNTWIWMRKSVLKGCTEALICSGPEQSLRTNYIKYNIDKTGESPLCRMCGSRNETISHIVSECDKLAQMECKRRRLSEEEDSVGRYVHWQFCEKLGFNRARLWYEHEPESVVENENFKILWSFTIQCDHMIETRRPDIVVVDKVKKEAMIIDVAIPGVMTVCDKE